MLDEMERTERQFAPIVLRTFEVGADGALFVTKTNRYYRVRHITPSSWSRMMRLCYRRRAPMRLEECGTLVLHAGTYVHGKLETGNALGL